MVWKIWSILKSEILVSNNGITLFQYRSKFKKNSQKTKEILHLLEVIRSKKGLLIINDDVKIALDTKADGVHLGENDMSLTQARAILGNDYIIGISCYSSIPKALNMEKIGLKKEKS